MILDETKLREIVKRALEEDVGSGDITTLSTIGQEEKASAELISREDIVVAGMDVARLVFSILDDGIEFDPCVSDGEWVKGSCLLAKIRGSARAILAGERVSLNFLQHLSGIATTTRKFVDAVKGTDIKILDTRKTIPGLRELEKYAVSAGGGNNHRMGLFDAILIKDNHIGLTGGIKEAVRRVRENFLRNTETGPPQRKLIEVETSDLKEVKEALDSGADIIMLDNFNIDRINEAVGIIGSSAKIEVSGGVTLNNVADIASSGVDFISIGSLTQSARAVDISLSIKPIKEKSKKIIR